MPIFQITLTASPTNQRVVSVEADNKEAAIVKAQQMAKTFPQFIKSSVSVTNVIPTPKGVVSGGLTDAERQIMNSITTGMSSNLSNPYQSLFANQPTTYYSSTANLPPLIGEYVSPFALQNIGLGIANNQIANQSSQTGPSLSKTLTDANLNTQLGPLDLTVPNINNATGETLTPSQLKALNAQIANQTSQISNAPNFSTRLLDEYSRSGETLSNEQIRALNAQIANQTSQISNTPNYTNALLQQLNSSLNSSYGTADDPNAGQFSTVVNPTVGIVSPRVTPTPMISGVPLTPTPFTDTTELTTTPTETAVTPTGTAVTSTGAAATPTEGFLAVLSAIQSMADVAPGGLFDLNALLAAITANPSLYLIEEITPITDAEGNTTYVKNQVINPVVAQLLDLQASGQTNLSNIELQRIIQTANVDIKRLEGENAVNLAKENNASEQEVARIQAAAQQEVGLAQAAATEKAAQYGATSPFGALAGAGASIDEVSQLAESLARGGMNPQDAIRQALATTGGAYGALGGLTDGYTVSDIAMLARGGLTPEQQLAQARVQALPGLATISPQSLGGLSAILGQEAVRGLFSPFTSQAQQPQTAQQMSLSNTVQPFSTMQTMGGTMGAPTPTLGQYERLTPFEQGVAGANIAATGRDIEQSILGATPGIVSAKGSLAPQAS